MHSYEKQASLRLVEILLDFAKIPPRWADHNTSCFYIGDQFWAQENGHPKNLNTIFSQDKFYSLKAHPDYFTV